MSKLVWDAAETRCGPTTRWLTATAARLGVYRASASSKRTATISSTPMRWPGRTARWPAMCARRWPRPTASDANRAAYCGHVHRAAWYRDMHRQPLHADGALDARRSARLDADAARLAGAVQSRRRREPGRCRRGGGESVIWRRSTRVCWVCLRSSPIWLGRKDRICWAGLLGKGRSAPDFRRLGLSTIAWMLIHVRSSHWGMKYSARGAVSWWSGVSPMA